MEGVVYWILGVILIDNVWILGKNMIYRKGINIGVIGGAQDKTHWGYVRKDKYEN